MTPPAIAGLILSGGASRRMGSPKALLTFEGEMFLDRLVRILSTACSPLVIVLGHRSDQIRQHATRYAGVTIATNPDPDRGMLSSLQCGLTLLREADAVLFTPVDYPAIEQATVARLVQAFAESAAPVVIPTHRGEHGHPVCISRQVAAELLSLPPHAQARDVIRGYYGSACFVEVDDPGIVRDIDRPEDYQSLLGFAESRR